MEIVGIISHSESNSRESTSTRHTTAVSEEGKQDSIPRKPPPPVSKWQYEQSEDKMRNAVSRFASLESNNQVDFDFPYNGGSSAEIVLQNSPRYGKAIRLQVNKGQFLCHYDGCTINVKFDDHPVQTFPAGEPSDGSSNFVFIRNDAQFLRTLRKAKTVTIEAQFYREGIQQFQFSPTGLEWQ